MRFYEPRLNGNVWVLMDIRTHENGMVEECQTRLRYSSNKQAIWVADELNKLN